MYDLKVFLELDPVNRFHFERVVRHLPVDQLITRETSRKLSLPVKNLRTGPSSCSCGTREDGSMNFSLSVSGMCSLTDMCDRHRARKDRDAPTPHDQLSPGSPDPDQHASPAGKCTGTSLCNDPLLWRSAPPPRYVYCGEQTHSYYNGCPHHEARPSPRGQPCPPHRSCPGEREQARPE